MDYDFIMANFTLNFYRDRLDEIMRKVYKALKPDGIFMVTSDGLSKDKNRASGKRNKLAADHDAGQ